MRDFAVLNSLSCDSTGKTASLLLPRVGTMRKTWHLAPLMAWREVPESCCSMGTLSPPSCHSRVELLQQGRSTHAHAWTQPRIGTAESDAIDTKIATRSSCYSSGQL